MTYRFSKGKTLLLSVIENGYLNVGTHAEVMALYRSSPAVSQIWALMVNPLSCTVRVLNSTPMVVLVSWLNSFFVKRDNKLLLPTPDSPIKTTGEDTDHRDILI